MTHVITRHRSVKCFWFGQIFRVITNQKLRRSELRHEKTLSCDGRIERVTLSQLLVNIKRTQHDILLWTEQGWRTGESVRLRSIWPAFESCPLPNVGWVCICSRPCSEGFFSPGSPGFLPPQKPTSPNSNSTKIEEPHEHQLRLLWLPL